MSLRDELDKLASALCKKALLDATPIEASTDALKAATGYYAVREKVKLKAVDDDSSETPVNFAGFQGAIQGASGEEPVNARSTQPPASRRRVS